MTRSERRKVLAMQRRKNGVDLSKLSVDQLVWYRNWQQRNREYAASFVDEAGYYSSTFEPEYHGRFPLRRDIGRLLFPKKVPVIELTDTDETAASKYKDCLEGFL